jgi:ubiquitin related modifier 1
MASTIPIKLEFTYVPHIVSIERRKKEKKVPSLLTSNAIYHSGGLELLFSSQRSHKIALPSTDPSTNQPANVGFLIDWLCKNLMKDPRQDMFVLEGTV